MDLPCIVNNLENVGTIHQSVHLAIGVFDGLHTGHQQVLNAAKAAARASGGIAAVLSFDPHPSHLFNPDRATKLMLPIQVKLERLQAMGIELIVCQHFDREFASVSAANFLPYLQQQIPSLSSINVGENFRYGSQRLGTVDAMRISGRAMGIQVSGVARALYVGEVISSTRIRKQLEAGAIKTVNSLLGAPYATSGVIVAGKKIGRTLGFPTLNLNWAPSCQPKYGVYAVRFRENSRCVWQAGVANYGIKPTISASDQNPCLEVHALKQCRYAEGDSICVEWLDFVRAERRFESLDALQAQIAHDKQSVIEFFVSDERFSS